MVAFLDMGGLQRIGVILKIFPVNATINLTLFKLIDISSKMADRVLDLVQPDSGAS